VEGAIIVLKVDKKTTKKGSHKKCIEENPMRLTGALTNEGGASSGYAGLAQREEKAVTRKRSKGDHGA